MNKRIVQIAFYSFLGLILILSILVKTSLNFQANTGISILVFAIVLVITLNFFLKRIEAKSSKIVLENLQEPHDKLTLNHFLCLVFYSGIISLYVLLTSTALFALQTRYFGNSSTVILKGQITHPSFTFSKKPCINRLRFPRSHWSAFSYLCLDEYPTSMQKNGYYQLKLKTSFLGSNITHFQWIDDQIDPIQRMQLDMDPQLKELLKIYAKFEKELGPPITIEEAQKLVKRDQSQ